MNILKLHKPRSWTETANGANKRLVLHVRLRCGSLSITATWHFWRMRQKVFMIPWTFQKSIQFFNSSHLLPRNCLLFGIICVSWHTVLPVPCSLVVTCWDRTDLLTLLYLRFSCCCFFHFPIRCPGSGVVFEKLLAFCYVCFVSYCLVCSLQPCGHLLGKGRPLDSLVCDVFLCFCYFPIWCPGSGVAFENQFAFWYLCFVSYCLVYSLQPCGHLLGRFSCMWFFLCFFTFPYSVLGQVCFLIVSIPNLCLLPYFAHNCCTKRKISKNRENVGSN